MQKNRGKSKAKPRKITRIREVAELPAIRKRNNAVIEYRMEHMELCVWKPPGPVTTIVDEFLDEVGKLPAEEEELALQYLYLSNFDLERALSMYICSNEGIWNPFTESEMDKFDAAIEQTGKDFVKLKGWFPNRCTKELVQLYYMRKHRRNPSISQSSVVGREVVSSSSSVSHCEAAVQLFKIQRCEMYDMCNL